ncbi:MAG TPA: L-lysine 6-transaminase [Mycobacteriales bacterium]|nr:L-lysine 6-transaminase [Mycobacteriales bacterium]
MSPDEVLPALSRHLLVDGFDLVLDLSRSEGVWLVDARSGKRWLDMFTFFASSALGMNHPKLVGDSEFRDTLGTVALSKVSNSDVYTVELARFADTFSRVLGDPELPHLFFIEGGALAVENALKVAFDWKSRRNEAAGRSPELGTKVLHLTKAFHGRTGYTLSLTNTEDIKTARFPKFDWPRIDSPAARFPLADFAAENAAAEAHALAQARAAFEANPHDIACFLCEPIQGEGGDNHLRPEFLVAMQQLCEEFDALFVLDEVQSGCGLTGTAWAYQQLGVRPDIVAFGKKLQVCGIMAGRRVDEVPDNVFVVSSRLNSTWGGNLTDMVRARRILEVIEADDLIAHAARAGEHLHACLQALARKYPALVTNVRGRGLMCALSLPSGSVRDDVLARCRDEESLLLLGCGTDAIRWRPMLCVSDSELDLAIAKLDAVLARTV